MNNAMQNRLGELVRQYRTRLGLTGKELGEKAGIDLKTIYAMEKGERFPRQINLGKLEAALGFRPGILVKLAASDLDPARITVDDLLESPEPAQEPQPLWSLDDLSTMELIAELAARVGRMESQQRRLTVREVPLPKDAFDLAAYRRDRDEDEK